MDTTEKNDSIQRMHEDEGRKKINKLKSKINTTQYNIEVSREIISETPSDKEREKLIDKNTSRKHAIGSLEKEIRDIEQELEERSSEVSS